MAKIPTTIITGFLGAGKTSLLSHILRNANGRKFAVLINEFGELGIDKNLIMACDIDGCTNNNIIELANGCICCTVADDFLPAMMQLLHGDNKPDHIIIETSGLALPKPLITAFNWHEIKPLITIDGVICVLDGLGLSNGMVRDARPSPTEHDDTPIEEVFEDQLVMADIVVLNKCDTITMAQIKEIHHKLNHNIIEGKRDGVQILNAVNGEIALEYLLGLDKKSENTANEIATHHDNPDEDHDHDEFVSVSMKFGAVADSEKFTEFLNNLVKKYKILRTKGFLFHQDKPRREVIQSAGLRTNRYFDRAWQNNEIKQSVLVFIGLEDMNIAGIQHDLLANYPLNFIT